MGGAAWGSRTLKTANKVVLLDDNDNSQLRGIGEGIAEILRSRYPNHTVSVSRAHISEPGRPIDGKLMANACAIHIGRAEIVVASDISLRCRSDDSIISRSYDLCDLRSVDMVCEDVEIFI